MNRNLNKEKEQGLEENIRSLELLTHISENESVSQRDLSKNIGTSLGLVNSYIKNLVSKGYITISKIPKKRYKYYLTAKGFSEKTRLTFDHLRNFTNLYKNARNDFATLFTHIKTHYPEKEIILCGIDEITEIAYLSLKEAELNLKAIIDFDDTQKEKVLGMKIMNIDDVEKLNGEIFIVTSLNRGMEIKDKLMEKGVKEERIINVGHGNWIEKIKKDKN